MIEAAIATKFNTGLLFIDIVINHAHTTLLSHAPESYAEHKSTGTMGQSKVDLHVALQGSGSPLLH